MTAHGRGRGRTLYPRVLALTTLGMLCRYLIELGEVSNTYNFTPFNMVAYLAAVPALALGAYWLFGKHLPRPPQ